MKMKIEMAEKSKLYLDPAQVGPWSAMVFQRFCYIKPTSKFLIAVYDYLSIMARGYDHLIKDSC